MENILFILNELKPLLLTCFFSYIFICIVPDVVLDLAKTYDLNKEKKQ